MNWYKKSQQENILKDDNILPEEIPNDNLKIPEKPKENIKMMELKNVQEGQSAIVKVYHGTPDGRFLPEFNPSKKGYFKNAPDLLPDNKTFLEIHGEIQKGFSPVSITGNKGVSFTDNKTTAHSYANKPSFDYQNSIPMVVERYVLLRNPKVIDLHGQKWTNTVNSDINSATTEGRDSIILKNIRDNYHPDTTKNPTNNLIVFNVDQIRTDPNFQELK